MSFGKHLVLKTEKKTEKNWKNKTLEKKMERVTEWGGGGTSEGSNRLELDQHYRAGQIQAEIPERGTAGIHRCVCVCALAFNLFIYLSLAAIMVFFPSQSVC